MKSICAVLIPLFFLMLTLVPGKAADPAAGFFLPDSVREMTLKYKTVRDLIILPVTLNDSIHVNLILDTGCRNLILFGKRFRKLFKMSKSKPIEFSGLGSGRAVTGNLSLNNRVSIKEVLGEQIPVVIVNSNNLFGQYHNVHGVVGYEIFMKFEIELNPAINTITFRQALKSTPPAGFSHIPLRIVDARPIMQSQVLLEDKTRLFDLMIDTGSTLGLLLKTTNISEFRSFQEEKVLGIGFNGPLSGYETVSEKLIASGLEIDDVRTGIVSSPWHNNASIGMDILKNYVVIINYCKSYVCFKRNEV